MMIKSFDEFDLQRKIKNIMNNKGFRFEQQKANYFCDLVDSINKIYCEVKEGKRMASAQILYGIVKFNITDSKYIALASQFEIRFFETPDFKRMEKFARNISPTLSMMPSNINAKYDQEAFEILGEYGTIFNYKGKFLWNQKLIFLTEDNYDYVRILFEKYNIDSSDFINKISDVYARNGKVSYMEERLVIGVLDKEGNFPQIKCSNINYKGDQQLIENLRIRSEDMENLMHKLDTLKTIKVRRKKGQFFTNRKIANIVNQVIEVYIQPDFIIEPYCGTGTLISQLMDEYNGFANDIDKGYSDHLSKFLEGTNWKVYNFDFIEKSNEEILKLIPKDCKNLLLLSNPPFGSISTNKLASKKGEVEDGKSRQNKIEYFGLDKLYGKGDLVLPALGKMIEVIKYKGTGFLGFFSQFGIFCQRSKYLKILNNLLKDFKYIDGYIFSGEEFNGVAKSKPIQFSLWEYNKDIKTDLTKIQFNYDDLLIGFKRTLLLKEGWRYRDGIKYVSEKKLNSIDIFRCEAFNSPYPKLFGIHINDGSGCNLSSDNVKIDLKINNIPSELIYGLWSSIVGYHGISKYPIYIDNAYVHLPDFQLDESKQILAYALIFDIITEILNNYTKGKIAFIGMQRIFKFGDIPELTKGCQFLIETYGNCSIDDEKKYTIKSVFDSLKNEPDILKIDDSIRKSIRKKIDELLDNIGYYKFIPLPLEKEDE